MPPAAKDGAHGDPTEPPQASEFRSDLHSLDCKSSKALAGYMLVVILFLNAIAYTWVNGVISSGPAETMKDLGLDVAEFGALMSVPSWIQAVVSLLVSGELVDVLHRPITGAVVLVLCSVFAFFLPWAKSLMFVRGLTMQTADAVLQSTPSSHSHAAEFNRYWVGM